jgi:hypothetical protein
MQRGHAAEAEGAQVEAFEDVEDLDERRAPGTGRGSADDLEAAVHTPDRLALHGVVVRQVPEGDEPAASLHLRDQKPGRLALVETGRALLRDATQRATQVRLAQHVAHLVGLAFLGELGHRRGMAACLHVR